MSVFEFEFTGRIEADADELGIAAANSVRRRGDGAIDVESGFKYRMDPAAALETLLQMGLTEILNAKMPDGSWSPQQLDATVKQMD